MSALDPTNSPHPVRHRVLALVPVWDAGEEIRILPDHGLVAIGTDRAADIRIRMAGVAPQHCQIECTDGHVAVSAIGSNEVILNRQSLSSTEAVSAGDTIQIGPAEFRFESRQSSCLRRFQGRPRPLSPEARPRSAPKQVTDLFQNSFI